MPSKASIGPLEAEAAELTLLLAQAEEYGDVVGQIQYKERLDEVAAKLAEFEGVDSTLANVALYFSGKPVVGSRGISANFAGKLLELYQDLVSKAFAQAEIGALGQRGRVPLRQSTDLMITGLTHGSFGFVLEELSDQTEIHDTALKEILTTISNLLRSVVAESEDEFDRVIEELDARTLVTLRDFFTNMDSAEASVRIVEDRSELALDSTAIHRGRIRTEATEIEEHTQTIQGILSGFLPEHRRFELRIETGDTLWGTTTKEAAEQFESAIKNDRVAIGSLCVAEYIVREIKPLNRPPRLTYRLKEFSKLGESEE